MNDRNIYKTTVKFFETTNEKLKILHELAKEKYGFKRFNVSGFLQYAISKDEWTEEYLEKKRRGEL